MAGSLDGQVAVVTGGARGIGRGIAERLRDHGARVAIWDVQDPPADAWPGDDVQHVDVADYDSVTRGYAATTEALGPVDILVNNAGINGPIMPLDEYPLEAWHRVIAVDLTGVFHGCRVAAPSMRARGYGRIVNVSSITGKEGMPNIAPYAAAKAGVIGLTKSLARELAGSGVLVNAIAPAITETPLFDEMTREHIESAKSRIPLGRFLTVPEIAAMVAWIAGPECSFTTGFVFDLSGGRATY